MSASLPDICCVCRFQGRLSFAEVGSKVGDVVAQHGITKFPTLFVTTGSPEQAEEYTGTSEVFRRLYCVQHMSV